MLTDIISVTIIVRDQQEALAFYTEKLGFEKRSEMPMGPSMQWLTIGLPSSNIEFVLQPTSWFEGEEREQKAALIGKSPTIVFRVDDCRSTCEMLRKRGVTILDEPKELPYGVQAIIADLYGNGWVLLEPPRLSGVE